MATKTDTTRLEIEARDAQHSRANRRLRREGKVPGVIYGRGQDPRSFAVDALELRRALASSGAVFELALDGATTPAVVKDTQRHPVRGEVMHIDFVRVDLNTAITATVTITVTGGDAAPGVVDGGILTQELNEVEIEALPADVPDAIAFDASDLQAADTVYLNALTLPSGVKLTADEETASQMVLVSITTPAAEVEDEPAIEAETEVVGEGEGGEDAGEGGEGGSPEAAADDASE